VDRPRWFLGCESGYLSLDVVESYGTRGVGRHLSAA
jgi:hypothetical protein